MPLFSSRDNWRFRDANLKFPKQRPSSSWLQLKKPVHENHKQDRRLETGETIVESSTHTHTRYCPHFSYLRIWQPCSNVIPQFPVTNPLHWTWIQVLEQWTRKGFFIINIPSSFKTSCSGEVSFGRKWNTLVILSYLNNPKPASGHWRMFVSIFEF